MRRIGRLLRRWAWWLVVLGLAVAAWAGVRAGRYQPSFFDPGDPPPCSFDLDGCAQAAVDGALRALWWWVIAGSLVALAGVVLTVWRMPTQRRGPAAAGWSAAAEAAAVALVGGLVAVVLSVPVLMAIFLGPHAMPGALVAVWLVLAGVTGGVHHTLGPPATTPRRSWLIGLAAAAAAVAAAVGLTLVRWEPLLRWWSAAVVAGAVLAVVVVVARVLAPSSAERPASGPGRGAVGAGAVAVLAAVALWVWSSGTGRDGGTSSAREPAQSVPDGSAVPYAPVPEAGPPPRATTTLPPPMVSAPVPCGPADLSFSVTGFDAAMGARAATLVATNTGPAPCWVEGVPAVTLLQGGRVLEVTVEPAISSSGGPPAVQRVGISPGGSASALLTWRTYAGWADAETPQTVTAALDASSPPVPVTVPGGSGPAPFDLADGGTWAIAPWAPPSG